MSRRLVFCPELNPKSFVLLFVKNAEAGSWSVRDFSKAATVSIRYARELPPLAKLQTQIAHSISAPSHSVSDIAFWHAETIKANALHLCAEPAPAAVSTLPGKSVRAPYLLLNETKLTALPKGRKTHDLQRMRSSSNSEDWITWSAFELASTLRPGQWWTTLVALVQQQNPALELPEGWQVPPLIDLWPSVASPLAYERALRQILEQSSNPRQVRRSQRSAPVEGESEIDIMLKSSSLTVFIEAKLGADVSLATTNDSARNQIARNIDCLLDVAGDSRCFFWMLVRDRAESRSYVQLLAAYRANPDLLKFLLPHRAIEQIQRVASNLGLVTWADFIRNLSLPLENASPEESTVYEELCRRIDLRS